MWTTPGNLMVMDKMHLSTHHRIQKGLIINREKSKCCDGLCYRMDNTIQYNML